MDFLAELVCDEDWFPAVCEDVIFLLAGFDKAQMNETLLDTIVHHSPAGTSARAVVHYAQEVNSGIHSRTSKNIQVKTFKQLYKIFIFPFHQVSILFLVNQSLLK